MIELSHISKSFHTASGEVKAVQDVSLSIHQGEIYGIIGFSGAGKSTLVRCINLLEPPNTGTVTVDGVELTALPPKQLREARKKIGMIFQQFNLMPSRTVFDNVAFPLRRSGRSKQDIAAKVRELLALVDIADKEHAYPSQLSGGQKQRVAIARALASDPKVLLCDEATSALDPQTTNSILQLLKRLNAQIGITIVIITHEMSVVRDICDSVAVMERGNVVERGDVFDIFSNPKQDITKEFIRSTSNLQKAELLLAQRAPLVELKPGQLIVRLNYVEKNVSLPYISIVSREYNIDFNIILGDIDFVKQAPVGGTVAIVSGAREDITRAIAYLIEENIGVEVLADARAAV